MRILTMQMGQHSVLVTGELQVREAMSIEEVEVLLRRIDKRIAETTPDVANTFWELRREADSNEVLHASREKASQAGSGTSA